MPDWALVLAGPAGALARRSQVRSLMRALSDYDQRPSLATSNDEACRRQLERRHTVEAFLEDPGYADEAALDRLHDMAPDVLSADELESYRLGPWGRHCTLRLAETLLHLVVIAQTAVLLAWLWSGAIFRFPQLAEALLPLWVLLLYADLIWTMYLSRVARTLLLNPESWQGFTFEQLIDLTFAGLPLWQRPAGLVIAPIAKRLGPAGVRTAKRNPDSQPGVDSAVKGTHIPR